MTKQMSAVSLLEELNLGHKVQLIDVREPEEFSDWYIPSSINLPLGTLAGNLEEIDRTEPVVLVCLSGGRADRAASILAAEGFDTAVLSGGMGSWSAVADEVETKFGPFSLVQVRRRGKGCLSYVVAVEGSAVVIDASLDSDRYVAIARRLGAKIVAVTDTHLHADHISGTRRLAQISGAKLMLSPDDAFEFPFTELSHKDQIELGGGQHLGVSVIPTPGHTTGSTVFTLGESAVITGDTLFLDSVGRPDLAEKAEEFAHSLYHSLHEQLFSLSDEIMVLPGHYSAATELEAGVLVSDSLGSLRARLAPLTMEEPEFVTWAVAQASPRPPSYVAIIEANRFDSNLSLNELARLEIGPNRCAVA